MEYYAAVKRSEMPLYGATRINLKTRYGRKSSQTQKTPCCMVLFTANAQKK